MPTFFWGCPALPDHAENFMTRARTLYRENRKEVLMIAVGLVFLIISVPTFLFYNLFPTISVEIGPHQISSWLSVTFAFVGFGLIIFGMSKMNI